jgi:hypothetical protein
MAGSLAAAQGAPGGAAPETGMAPPPGAVASAEPFGEIETKQENLELERWKEILGRSFERVIERQQRVTMEKVNGMKSKKALAAGTLDIESIFSVETWNKQMEEDIRPVLATIIQDSQETSKKSLNKVDVLSQIDSHIAKFKQVNTDTHEQLVSSYMASLPVPNEDNRSTVFRASCVGIFTNLLAKTRYELSETEARRAWGFAS